jgi:hypothetical protein
MDKKSEPKNKVFERGQKDLIVMTPSNRTEDVNTIPTEETLGPLRPFHEERCRDRQGNPVKLTGAQRVVYISVALQFELSRTIHRM